MIINKICKIFDISDDEFYYGTLNKPANTDDAALKKHYEILWMESELRNIKLKQEMRNYKPLIEPSENSTHRIYVII